ncbi:hypothetical protein OnM2_064070 [Erysiphe neolycopersici]|uniref:SWIM-type domain-containing protein n=1 Tax=Erysiphe neolycopersici TaxID=212602 RepID=A0A420HNA5_9PEZI|nr:hypothetical protein OnM2_064070 [Erysiphe neolycopersici]
MTNGEREFVNFSIITLTEEISVNSFSDYNKNYNISLDNGERLSKCSCKFMPTSFIVCNHMHMASRVLSLAIRRYTRANSGSSSRQLISHPEQEPDFLQQPAQGRDFIDQILSHLEPLLDQYSELDDLAEMTFIEP